ncbi:MAG: hypothetical protein AB1896_22260, partial [Thermodesulfobacteriota bacterium]
SAIVPFQHVDGLVPGRTTYQDVVEMMGPPEERQDVETGFILRYPSRGFFFIVDLRSQPGTDNPVIDSVYVEAPYRGRSPEGLYIGQPEQEALAVLDRHFHLDMRVSEGCYYYSEKPGLRSDFTVWFENGILVRMKLWPRTP